MRAFDCVYEGKRYPVMASTHVAARSLGTRHIANLLGAIVPSKVAVVDLEIAAGYRPKRYLDITQELSGADLVFIANHERLHAEFAERRDHFRNAAHRGTSFDE